MKFIKVEDNTLINIDRIDGIIKGESKTFIYVGGCGVPFETKESITDICKKIEKAEE